MDRKLGVNLCGMTDFKEIIAVPANFKNLIYRRSNISAMEIGSWKTFFYVTLQDWVQSQPEFSSQISSELFNED